MTSAMNFGDAMMQPHHCYGALKGQGTEGLLHMNDIRVRHELRIRVRILGYNSYIPMYYLTYEDMLLKRKYSTVFLKHLFDSLSTF